MLVDQKAQTDDQSGFQSQRGCEQVVHPQARLRHNTSRAAPEAGTSKNCETIMLRPVLTAGALCCALSLGACNTTAISNLAGTLTAGTITLGQLTPAILDAAGVSTADKDKANAILSQIVNTARLSCGLAPTATSILNIVAALNPTATAVAVPINTVVNVACEALTAPTAQVVTSNAVKATRARVAAAAPVVQTVRGQISVNGVVVTVTGFTDPTLAVSR